MKLRRLAWIALYFTVAAIAAVGIAAIYYRHVQHRRSGEAQRLLDKADELAWNGQWILAEPMYKQAQRLFKQQGDTSRALYAEVSQTISHLKREVSPIQFLNSPKH